MITVGELKAILDNLDDENLIFLCTPQVRKEDGNIVATMEIKELLGHRIETAESMQEGKNSFDITMETTDEQSLDRYMDVISKKSLILMTDVEIKPGHEHLFDEME